MVFFHSYWDLAYDSDVMEDSVGLNLLYAQVRYAFFPFEMKGDVKTSIHLDMPALKNEESWWCGYRQITYVFMFSNTEGFVFFAGICKVILGRNKFPLKFIELV